MPLVCNKADLQGRIRQTVWARSLGSELHKTTYRHSSDTAPAPHEPGRRHLERCLIQWFGAGLGSDASRCTRLWRLKVAVELAKESVLVLCRPVGQVVDKLFDLLPASIFQGLGAAEVDGVGLDQDRIELVLTDQLAQTIAKLGFRIPAIPVDRF